MIAERILRDIQLYYIYLIASAKWTCYTQQRLLHSYTSCLHSSPSCPSVFKTLMCTSFSCHVPLSLCPLFSHSCFPSLLPRTSPGMSGLDHRPWCCCMTEKCWSALYPALLHPLGREAVEKQGWSPPVSCVAEVDGSRNTMESLQKMEMWKAQEIHEVQSSHAGLSHFCIISIIILYLNIYLDFSQYYEDSYSLFNNATLILA